jgi:hypothetical protein
LAGRLIKQVHQGRSGTAGAFGATAGAPGTKINGTIQLETIHLEIHFDGLRFFQEFRIDDKLETVDVKGFIRINKLIQSHGQARAPSPAFVEENTDWFDLFSFEIFCNLLNCRLRDL